MEGATVSKPSAGAYATKEWTPYTALGYKSQCMLLPGHMEELHRQRVLLAEIMTPAAYAL